MLRSENFVGRSRPFWEHFYPRAQQVFGEALAGVALDDFLFAVNDVRRSLIRVEADEATYNLHIILRFELEQALVKGDLRGIARARRLSRATMRNIRQNLAFAFLYNVLGVPVASGALYPAFGLLLSPMFASAAMMRIAMRSSTSSPRNRTRVPRFRATGVVLSVTKNLLTHSGGTVSNEELCKTRQTGSEQTEQGSQEVASGCHDGPVGIVGRSA